MELEDIKRKKGRKKIVMLTAYDYSFARIIEEAGIDIILVGDSLANVVLGMKQTKEISFEEMFNHTKAVKKAAKDTLVVADMPYVAYQENPSQALFYAKKFVEEAGADAVKIEWFEEAISVTQDLIENNIPVMGHIGLTPQTVDKLGGFKVQGKDYEGAKRLLRQAKIWEREGIFSIVLECIPYELARLITHTLRIPTIGIGAGPFCDGQVLVLYDILGLYKNFRPKFVKVYKDISSLIKEAVLQFKEEVEKNIFPPPPSSFTISQENLERLKKELGERQS